MEEIKGWTTDWSKADREYSACDGKVKFTNRDATHAVHHFHDVVDPERYMEVPYMIGIMGGCFAHACDLTEELIAEIESDDKYTQEMFMIWARMISAYFQAKSAGIFEHPEAHLS